MRGAHLCRRAGLPATRHRKTDRWRPRSARRCAAADVRVFLEVAEDNDAGSALYAERGLRPVGRRRRYYRRAGDVAVDALIMSARALAREADLPGDLRIRMRWTPVPPSPDSASGASSST